MSTPGKPGPLNQQEYTETGATRPGPLQVDLRLPYCLYGIPSVQTLGSLFLVHYLGHFSICVFAGCNCNVSDFIFFIIIVICLFSDERQKGNRSRWGE